jgi:hypothetical protein
MTNDVRAEGERHCAERNERMRERGQPVPTKFRFVGVATASVYILREQNGITPVDIIFTPNCTDRAHSDFVALAASDNDIPALIDWLQEQLRFVETERLSKLNELVTTAELPDVSTSGGALEVR